MNDKHEIKEFFKDNFMIDTEEGISDDESLLEKGVIDSTGVLELVSFIEEKYQIKVEDEELIPENLDSFNNIEKYINSKL